MAPEQSRETPLSNPRQGEASCRHHPYSRNKRSESRAVDNTSCPHEGSALNNNVEDDKRILHEYNWELYKGLPTGMQEAMEVTLLMRLGNMSYETCATCLKNHGDVRALLLEGWEKGTFQALRSHPTFAQFITPAAHGKNTTALLSSHEPMDVSPEEFAPTDEDTSVAEMDEPRKTLETPSGQALARMDEDEDEDMDTESNYSDYVHADGSSGKTNVAKLHISKSKFTAGRDIRVAVTIWRTAPSSNENQKIAEWFFDIIDYRSMHNEIAKKRMAGTGEWLLRSKAYGEWFTSPQQRLMWCPGIPGVGKTVMASLVVDHLRMLDESCIFVGVIYFNYKFRSQQTKRAILGAICRQMSELRENTALKGLYDSHSKQKSRPTEAELQSALFNAFQDYQSCYLVLDALDEFTAHYSDKQIREIIKDILSLGENVKLLITSRVLGEMEATFKELGASREEIIADDVDMRVYVAERVEALKSRFDYELSEEFSAQVVRKVMEAARGRFLVAELSVNLLAEQLNLGDLEDALDKLPNGIDETYIRVIELIKRYPKIRRELAMKALMWIAYAQRRLSVRELQHAIATKHEGIGTDRYITPLSTITSLCAGLIVVEDDEYVFDDNRTVRFVHFTTQEFFGRTQLDYFRDAHKEIFLTCIECLSNTADRTPSQPLAWLHGYDSPGLLRHPFYNYAALNWGYHANTHHGMLQKEVGEYLSRNDQALEFSWRYTLQYSAHIYDENIIENTGSGAGLFLAAYHNQSDALPALLDQMDTIPLTKQQRTPMHIAVIVGGAQAVREMIRWARPSYNNDTASVVINPGKHTPRPTTRCRPRSKIAFIENLRDLRDGFGRTPLSYASRDGQEPIVKLLLEHGANVDSKDTYGGTPLSYAIEKGREPIIKLLLEHGAKVDSRDKYGKTLLSNAAQDGQKPIVKLLLEHGANVDSKDTYGGTPLSYAVEKGWEPIAKLLLEYRAEVNSKDAYGKTLLLCASRDGQEPVVKLLLEYSAEVDSRDACGRTPLSYAAQDGQEPIVKLLLEYGAEVDSRDAFGRTPLSYAAQDGQGPVVKLLLEHGAKVNSEDTCRKTPLSYVARDGQAPVIKVLLEYSAEVDSKDVRGRTPLSYAAQQGHVSIIELLLAHGGIEVDSRDDFGWSPLYYAYRWGRKSTVELLRSHGACWVVPMTVFDHLLQQPLPSHYTIA